MNIIFKSKREMYAFSIGTVLLLCLAVTMAVIMLWSMRFDGLARLNFNGSGELWIELPLAVLASLFGLWLMWFVAMKSKIGHIPYLTKQPLNLDKPGRIITEDALIREWDNEYDEVWDDA